MLRPEENPEKIKELLIKQIYSTVRWRESLNYMSGEGVENFFEVGPGKALTGMVKRSISRANCFSINTIADINKLNNELKNKKVLITGATGGIGQNILEQFNKFGAKIVASGTNEVKLKKISENYPQVLTEKFKLDEHNNIEKFIEKVSDKLGGLDVLVNNAGITMDNISIRLTEENWKKVLDVNLTSSFLMCKYAIKKMLKHKSGKIINITSIVGHTGNLGQANYSASKAGIVAFSKSLALEYAKKTLILIVYHLVLYKLK